MVATLPKIGDNVSELDLKDIYDKHIVLINSYIKDNIIHGTVGFIGDKLNAESDKLNTLGVPISDIYNSSEDSEDGVSFDE